MTYKEIVKQTKGIKTLMFFAGFPICVMIVLNIWGFNILGMGEKLSTPMKLGVSLLFGLVSEEIVRLYLKFNKQLNEMKRSVDARSDADMEKIIAESKQLGDEAWLSEKYILNFYSMRAYLRRDALRVERSGKQQHQVYGIRLAVSGQEDDWIFFQDEASREQAYEMFRAEIQARQM